MQTLEHSHIWKTYLEFMTAATYLVSQIITYTVCSIHCPHIQKRTLHHYHCNHILNVGSFTFILLQFILFSVFCCVFFSPLVSVLHFERTEFITNRTRKKCSFVEWVVFLFHNCLLDLNRRYNWWGAVPIQLCNSRSSTYSQCIVLYFVILYLVLFLHCWMCCCEL